MSGFEIVGLLLAAPPVIISALDAYKASINGVQRLFAWDSELRQLILSLRLQDTKFRLNLQKLVRAAAPEEDTLEITEDVIWKGVVGNKVSRYLGPAADSFRDTVNEYGQVLRQVVRKLKNVNRPKAAARDDLSALIAANPSKDGCYSFRKKVDFTMKHRDVMDLISKLDHTNMTLTHFISDSDFLDRHHTNTDSLRSLNLASRLYAVRMHAENLHAALAMARTPTCSADHKIALHLEARIPSKPQKAADISFSVSVATNTTAWCETVITVGKPQTTLNPLKDLCWAIQQAEHPEHSFHLLNDVISKIKLPHCRRLEQRAVVTTTLADVLACNNTITPKDTTIIALKLASSLVQLSATGWLDRCWSKDDISFFSLSGKKIYFTSSPIISKTFHSTTSGSCCNVIKPIEALFELGVILMEIGYQRSFESWLLANNFTVQDKSRWARIRYAMQWHEESEGTLPIRYRIVIAKCLKCSFDEYEISWDCAEFRQAVCREIIEPLHENASIW